jgi:YesN/AraC family two-component response regulator
MYKNHFHDFYEVYYHIKGQRYYFVKDNAYLIMPGDLVLIKENTLHKAFSPGNMYRERYLLYIDKEYVKSNLNAMNSDFLFEAFDNAVVIRGSNHHKTEEIFERIHQLHDDYFGTEHYDVKLFSLIVELLGHVYDIYISQGSFNNINHMNHRITEIVEYITIHYKSSLSLSGMASHFNISRYYLCKLFKENIGLTFSDYLNNIRIMEAKKLLVSSQMRITKIADKVGYTNTSYFCKVFKKTMGMSALEYRVRKRQN